MQIARDTPPLIFLSAVEPAHEVAPNLLGAPALRHLVRQCLVRLRQLGRAPRHALLELRVCGSEALFGAFALRDIQDELDPLGLAEPLGGQQAPEGGAILADATLLTGGHAPRRLQDLERSPSVSRGVRRRERAQGQRTHPHVFSSVARHPAEGVVGVGDRPAVIEENDTDGLDLEGVPEPLLALPQQRRGARLLDGGPHTLGRLFDVQDLRSSPDVTSRVMHVEGGAELALLDHRHAHDRADTEGPERLALGDREALIQLDVVDSRGEARVALAANESMVVEEGARPHRVIGSIDVRAMRDRRGAHDLGVEHAIGAEMAPQESRCRGLYLAGLAHHTQAIGELDAIGVGCRALAKRLLFASFLREIAADVRESDQVARAVANGRPDLVHPEAFPILAHAPAFALRPAIPRGVGELASVFTRGDVTFAIKHGRGLADGLFRRVAQHARCADGPRRDGAARVHQKNGVVVHVLHDRPKPLLGFTQRRLGIRALRRRPGALRRLLDELDLVERPGVRGGALCAQDTRESPPFTRGTLTYARMPCLVKTARSVASSRASTRMSSQISVRPSPSSVPKAG